MGITTTLPNLESYRALFLAKGVQYPLQKIGTSAQGLLQELPKTERKGWPWDSQTSPLLYHAKKEWPKITIVTPSFNQGQYIEETIRSVLLQNYPNLEYIVIDGGSTDGTLEILAKYSPWISYWVSEKDKGHGHAINKGFSLASGKLYGWINSDDLYMDEAFFTLANAFEQSKADMIYGDGLVIDEASGELTYEKAFLVNSRYLFIGGVLMQHSTFWKADIHEPIQEALYCAVDSELWFRLVPKKKLKHVKFPLGIARKQPEAKTMNEKFAAKWKADNILIAQLHQFEKTIPFFKYIQSKFYILETRYVQRLYKYFNRTNTAPYLAKLASKKTKP